MSAQLEIVISRLFDAPRELVFKTFTEVERMQQWWGSKGFANDILKFEPHPGGVFHGRQESPEGHVMWGIFEYREVVENEKIVFTSSVSNEEGDKIRAPFSETWPMEILNTVTFEEQEGKTLLTMRGVPFQATEDEIKTFEDAHEMLEQGFAGTFEQLGEYLAKA